MLKLFMIFLALILKIILRIETFENMNKKNILPLKKNCS